MICGGIGTVFMIAVLIVLSALKVSFSLRVFVVATIMLAASYLLGTGIRISDANLIGAGIGLFLPILFLCLGSAIHVKFHNISGH